MTNDEIIKSINEYGRSKTVPFVNNEPKNLLIVESFLPLDKGCLIYIKGERYPIRGHLRLDKHQKITQFKRLIPELMSGFRGGIFKKFVTLIYFYFNWENYLNWFHFYLSDLYMEQDRYCQPVREIYTLIKNEKIRDIICSILEYDTAYRYRLQDVMPYLSNSGKTINELKKLLGVLIKRENSPDMASKWKKIRSLVWILRIKKGALQAFSKFINSVSLENVISSKEDIYWQEINPDYNYGGLDFERRMLNHNQKKLNKV